MSLFWDRRFWPLFWTQFLGAFNDNLFKNALIILVVYRSISVWGLDPGQVAPLCAGLFILPFFLMSAQAGQLADKYSKGRALYYIKLAEIVIMLVAAFAFMTDDIELLVIVLFLLGTQAAFFGPAKYSILPELLTEAELVKGNALVETGTFVAILLGTIAGGLLAHVDGIGPAIIATAGVILALIGWVTSAFIQKTPRGEPDLRVARNPFSPLGQILGIVRERRPVFLSVLGISWFWFFGASFLTLFPTYTKEVLRGNEHVVTLLLAMFCVGIAVGSMLCGRLSRGRLELGLVPFGSIGMTLFVLDLFFVGDPYARGVAPGAPIGLAQFLEAPSSLRICFDLLLVSVFGGFFTVPLYTMIQQRSRAAVRSRIIAGTNILNALFMVLASVALMALSIGKVSIPTIFLLLSAANFIAAVYIYCIIPEFLLRFVAWILASIIYRVRVTGADHIPAGGPVVLVCNHVSFVDWLIIASVSPRPPRFVMHHTYFDVPLLGFLFRDAKVIPIASEREDAGRLEQALLQVKRELEEGEVVCIFPEGRLTDDGGLKPFRRGIERIVAESPVTVVPMALSGLWGSWFSKKSSKRAFGKLWARVDLRIGSPVAAESASAAKLESIVRELGGFAAAGTGDLEQKRARA